MISKPTPVLIAGIAGASLGTEIFKCLRDSGAYAIFGCDISEYAYGHYLAGLTKTFIVDENRYVESVLAICKSYGIRAVVPGGERPLALLGPIAADFQRMGIHIAANSPDVIAICSDKKQLFDKLQDLGLQIPRTVVVEDANEVEDIPCPCVVKPTVGTGGSQFVFLASTRVEATVYLNYLLNAGKTAMVQEYIPLDEGEFTVGVLMLPNGQLVGTVAMRRFFHAKLSVLYKTNTGLISSGYSQGLIDEFPEVKAQAERIARALSSVGPMNIQGRVRNGVLLPFEINPRFSASTYLRAMAGFNEVDIYLKYAIHEVLPVMVPIRPGYYLRSLTEACVEKELLKR